LKRLLTRGSLLAFCAAVSACGSAASTPNVSTPSATPDLHALAAQYAAIADQGNTAMAQITLEFRSDTTVAQYNATARKAKAVYDAVDGQLLKLQFPDSMHDDVRALLKADGVIEAIFLSISTDTTIAAIYADADKLTAAGASKSAAVAVIRKDLSLPPATASTA